MSATIVWSRSRTTIVCPLNADRSPLFLFCMHYMKYWAFCGDSELCIVCIGCVCTCSAYSIIYIDVYTDGIAKGNEMGAILADVASAIGNQQHRAFMYVRHHRTVAHKMQKHTKSVSAICVYVFTIFLKEVPLVMHNSFK